MECVIESGIAATTAMREGYCFATTRFVDPCCVVGEEMKPNVSVFVATSVDGFIAKEDGSIAELGALPLRLLRTRAYDFGFVQSTYAALNHD